MSGFTLDLFAGRCVVVTGAASGIGRATALAFAEHGAALVLVDRDANALEATAREVQAAGAPSCRTELCDLDVELLVSSKNLNSATPVYQQQPHETRLARPPECL